MLCMYIALNSCYIMHVYNCELIYCVGVLEEESFVKVFVVSMCLLYSIALLYVNNLMLSTQGARVQ